MQQNLISKVIVAYPITVLLLLLGCSSAEQRVNPAPKETVLISTETVHSDHPKDSPSEVQWYVLLSGGWILQSLDITEYPQPVGGKFQREVEPAKIHFSTVLNDGIKYNKGLIREAEFSPDIKITRITPLKAKVTVYNANCGAEETVCKNTTLEHLSLVSPDLSF